MSVNSLPASAGKRLARDTCLVMDNQMATSCFLRVKSVRIGSWKRIWKSQNPSSRDAVGKNELSEP